MEDLNTRVQRKDRKQVTINENIAELEEIFEDDKPKRLVTTEQKRASEYALIQYLSTLVKKRNLIESFDFRFVEYLLENGANINNCDVIGQSPFHIVAKYWNIDVARFLLDHGAEIDAQDCFGRSPLHDACELNYDDMVEFLLQNGANINIQTYDQKQ
ncbi:ankyrin repeat-containing protein DDB_G0279043-like, partial [Dendronephthya gigantea]